MSTVWVDVEPGGVVYKCCLSSCMLGAWLRSLIQSTKSLFFTTCINISSSIFYVPCFIDRWKALFILFIYHYSLCTHRQFLIFLSIYKFSLSDEKFCTCGFIHTRVSLNLFQTIVMLRSLRNNTKSYWNDSWNKNGKFLYLRQTFFCRQQVN